MRVVMFRPEFARQVEAGTKTQTIRAQAGCAPGDELSLREWRGAPYRSFQRTLGWAVCARVEAVEIRDDCTLDADGDPLTSNEEQALAVADGFPGWGHMRAWFDERHGLPFRGFVIAWRGFRRAEP